MKCARWLYRAAFYAQKPDGGDICFVPGGDYAAFINVLGYKSEPGDFVSSSGKVTGRHKGLIHYTIGQRRGLGLSAVRPKYDRQRR